MSARSKRHGVGNLNSSIGVMGILVLVILSMVVIYNEERDMRVQEQAYIEREASLNQQIEEEEQRTKTLTERKKYVATNQYIEEVAKSELGLLNSDEILIKAKDE